MRFRGHVALAVCLVIMTLGSPGPSFSQGAGQVGAVNLDAKGTPPGAPTRQLQIGTNIIYNELVETSSTGAAQIMFPDTSTLNVGQNSSIVINEYVYDPGAGSGKMIASIRQGVLRFVGGQISHTAGVTINSPPATIGIRGGVATIVYPIPPGFGGNDPAYSQARGELVIGSVGSIVVANDANSVTVRPGFMTWVTGPNDPIPNPVPVPDFILQQVMAALTSGQGQNGGAFNPPTNQTATQFGFGTTIVTDPSRPPATDPLGYVSIFGAGNAAAGSKSQGSQRTNVAAPPPPVTNYPGVGGPGAVGGYPGIN